MVRLTFSPHTLTRLRRGGPIDFTQETINVELDLPDDELNYMHTITLYDDDAHYLHWIVTNIRGNNLESGQTLFVYVPPDPPLDSGVHHYVLDVLRQRYPVEFDYRNHPREEFPIGDFIDFNNLEEYDQIEVTLSRPLEKHSGGRSYNVRSVDDKLSEKERKYCNCLVKVAERPEKEQPNNIFAVCAHSTGTSSRHCSTYYDFEKMSNQELQAYIKLHKIDLKGSFARVRALKAIHQKLGK